MDIGQWDYIHITIKYMYENSASNTIPAASPLKNTIAVLTSHWEKPHAKSKLQPQGKSSYFIKSNVSYMK